MSKPDFSVQSGDPMTNDERRQWICNAIQDLRKCGATETRAAVDNADTPTIVLVEGWITRPNWSDVPEPEFFMIKGGAET